MVEIKNGQVVLAVIKQLQIVIVLPDESEETIDLEIADMDVRLINDIKDFIKRRAQS